MAITAATKTSDFAGFLKPELAAPYFEQTRRASVAQQLGRQVPLGVNGAEIPVVTSKPKASWVAEAGQKPVTEGRLGLKTITPKKLAAITVVSAEVVRANPGSYMEIYKADVAEAFARAFDAAVFHGTETPFGEHIDKTTKTVTLGTTTADKGGVYGDMNASLKLLVEDKKRLTGWAFDTTAEPVLNSSVDLQGRPLFVDTVYENSALTGGRLLSRPAFYAEELGTETIVGYGGDWSQFIWGVVGGISYDISTEASVTINGQLTSLWEHNLVAIRAEAEYGALINDVEAFVKISE